MENVEATGHTVEEAIEKALASLGRSREEVEITVLVEGTRGILGIGSEEARVRVSRREPNTEAAQAAKETLQRLLELMDLPGQVAVTDAQKEEDTENVALNVRGEHMGILIGRRGETLAALQFLLGVIVNKRLGRWVRIIVDAEGYRERRERLLQDMAHRAAERAQRDRQPILLEPMIPSERRVIHLTLQDHPHVATHSIGEGDSRRVVVETKP